MRNFLRFLSLTTATQACLVINQVVLLPLQLRVWGQASTAEWLVVLAVANVASVADLGLRAAGHAELVESVRSNNPAARLRFRAIWALTRTLFVTVTLGIIAVQVASAFSRGQGLPFWTVAVSIAVALDTLTIVRGIWLDSLGYFNRVEAVYLTTIATRILTSVAALLLHYPPAALAWITLVTAAAGAYAQARLLSDPALLSYTAGGFDALMWRAAKIVRFVVAEPAANWVRLSLPVVTLAAFTPPRVVTTYVAFRAIFGLARQVINQVARYASVSYVRHLQSAPQVAERTVVRAALFSTLVAAAVASLMIADHGRLLRLWLSSADAASFDWLCLSFAVAAAAYGYQVAAGVMMRCGDVPGVAWRQYVYLIASAVAAVGARRFSDMVLYLALLGACEVLIAVLFMGALGTRVARPLFTGFLSSLAVLCALWVATRWDPDQLFATFSPQALGTSFAVAGAGMVALAAGYLVLDRAVRRTAPSTSTA